jgi:ubiquinone biosynthesis protein
MLLDTYASVPLHEVSLGRLLQELSTVLRDYRLRLPPNALLMVKALAAAEAVARTIDPQLNVVGEAEPLVRELVQRRYGVTAMWDRVRRMVASLMASNRRLPALLMDIVAKLQHGELAIKFEHENLGPLQRAIEEAAGRLTLGIIIGSTIIGSSMIVTTGVRPLLFGYPALGIVGYLFSAVMGLWLVAHIIRTGKR